MSEHDNQRVMELLAERATQGLSSEELNELNELLQQYPEWDNSQFDFAATAVDLADIEIDEPLPEALRDKILANAFQYVNVTQSQELLEPKRLNRQAQEETAGKQSPVSDNKVIAFPKTASRWQWAGWYVAAACLLLAVLGWWPRLNPQKTVTPSLFELRAKLLNEAPDVIQTSWKPTGYKGALGITGDVVWSNARQQGFMTFKGMPVLDPNTGEYQLWIFDAKQDERFPVDGGVFDVDKETGDVIIPIHAKLKVAEPTLFAVTMERPGGVVVSKRDPIVAVAKVD
jgi:hypothetical protein